MRSGASAPGAILGWCRARCEPGIGRIARRRRTVVDGVAAMDTHRRAPDRHGFLEAQRDELREQLAAARANGAEGWIIELWLDMVADVERDIQMWRDAR